MFLFLMAYSEQEQDKFTKIYQQHNDYLLRYARYLLHTNDQAEVAVQETFIRALKNLHKISEVECSKTKRFLVVTLERVAFTMMKKNSFEQFDEYDDEQPPEDIVDTHEDIVWNTIDIDIMRSIMIEILKALPKTDRQILELQVENHYSYKEISDLLGMTEKNISVRLTRMRKKIRNEYRKRREGAD